jgi:signal transduction histidine kinase
VIGQVRRLQLWDTLDLQMRFTVRRKVVIGVAIIVALGASSLFIVYRGLTALHTNLRELSDLEGPTVEAAYEMEINLVELVAQVRRYLESRDPQDLTRIATDRLDFERFHAQYVQLSRSPRTKDLASRVKRLYDEFVVVSDEMIANRDAESLRFAEVMRKIEEIDDIIDRRFEDRVDRSAAGALERLVDAIELEADVAEIGIWLTSYRQSRREQDRKMIWSNVGEFKEQAARLRRNPYLTASEGQTVALIETAFRDTVQGIADVLAFDAQILKDARRFEALRRELDDILDEELQLLAIGGLDQPIVDADAAVVNVAWRAGVLLSLFLFSACAVAALLILNLTRSVARLVTGTEAVGRGDLSARIPVKGRDELAGLADHFNHMVEQLEATTVSKAALQASESELRVTNAELRRQIADRQRAEAAERDLRAELHRNEMLTTMGSLVAGVAHEVRNPLFGISSTVDAIEARLTHIGTQATYADHLRVLRRELTRLTELMQDLLEYGKPTGLQISPTHIEDVLTRAMEACRALADEGGVVLSPRVAPDLDTIRLDSARMVQVFQNLLENAVHHSPRGKTVTVDVQSVAENHGTWLRCDVIDHGPGFDTEDLPHIFEPFFTRRVHGTGLGLSIVEHIIEQHGGRATARNGPDGGAILTVQLPLNGIATPSVQGEPLAAQNSARR